MAPKDRTNAPATSIAEAKLERQRKRIQEAEAALTAPPTPEKRTHPGRGKGKQWKPFDYTADSTQSNTPSEGGVAVSEVRVNTFRAPSRGSSVARSLSVLSQRTSETAPSDMERSDSVLTENGFQLYKGRKNRKNIGGLGAYEDKPEERQTTVEATFDKRDIYNVFGNALPGPDFIEENVGFRNGQLQFIQHPNGDVSAHQWSIDRYIWENIGQFSNIRKKVEGQLGADRLKGETAYQTIQQNTLAYFRTIAKQREANVMGLPFGPKEIQTAMPEPRVEIAAAPTGLKEPAQEPSETERPQAMVETQSSQYSNQDVRSTSQEPMAKPYNQSYFPPNVPQGPRADRTNLTANYGQHNIRQEDPFYSGGSYQQVYGGQSYGQPYYRQLAKSPLTRQYYPTPQRPQGLNYDFHFPPADATTHQSQGHSGQTHMHDEYATFQRQQNQLMQALGNQATNYSEQGYSQYQNTRPGVQTNVVEANKPHATTNAQTEAARPKPVTPYDTRTAIRGQLWKHVETAKERSLSQANIRTVLYDPYQNQSTTMKAEPEREPEKQIISPAFSKNITGNILQPPSSFDPTSSKFFPTVLAPDVGKQSSPGTSVAENNLRDSSPDPYPAKAYLQNTPLIMTSSDSKPTPQTFQGPFFANEPDLRSSIGSATTTSASKKACDEELHDWWTSGNTFVRQEEFFQRIKSVSKNSASMSSSPPAHLTPIGPPSRTSQKQQPAFDNTMTRLLIPVYENLASYVQGPIEKRRDYWSQWCQPPEWCIDRSEGGNDSLFDKDWGTPPARVGRDPRYSGRSWTGEQTPQRSPYGGPGGGGFGNPLDRRFGFGAMY